MNVFMILYTVGTLLKVEAALMLLPAAVGQAMAWKSPGILPSMPKKAF